ncbi:MAG: hypothetical protein P8Y95_03270 [Gammaproteobacteria bacterium]
MQGAFVELARADAPIAGYKAGLTAPASWSRFGAGEPVRGVLLPQGERIPGRVIVRDPADNMMIELEIGYVLGRDVHQMLWRRESPFRWVAVVIPVVELPDLSYADMAKVSVVDVVATNVSAASYLLGTERKTMPVDFSLDGFEVSLERDGENILRAPSGGGLGSQRRALHWLMRNVQQYEMPLVSDMVLISGALGGMVPAEPGHYVADYGPLGRLEFTIEAGDRFSHSQPRTESSFYDFEASSTLAGEDNWR